MSVSQLTASPVARLVFKEIKEGDLLKMQAKSNVKKSGGGARDFRFGSYKKISPMLDKLFPEKELVSRVRKKAKTKVSIGKGRFYWEEGGTILSKESCLEPPTTARASEARITKVHQYPCFDVSKIPVPSENDRGLFLLIQREDGSVWPYFINEQSLKTPGDWDKNVADELLKCLNAKRSDNTSALGYIDFKTGEKYCNGK